MLLVLSTSLEGRSNKRLGNSHTSPELTYANLTHGERHCSQSGKTLQGPNKTCGPKPTQIRAAPVCRPPPRPAHW